MSIDLQALSLRFKDTFSEMLEVVRTIEVEMDENTYRIDIVCGIGGAGTFYNPRYFIERAFILQPESYSDKKEPYVSPRERVFGSIVSVVGYMRKIRMSPWRRR